MVQEEENPKNSWTKGKLIQWLEDNGIGYPPKAYKQEIWEIARREAKKIKKFTVESIVREEGRGITILRLPPYHCK